MKCTTHFTKQRVVCRRRYSYRAVRAISTPENLITLASVAGGGLLGSGFDIRGPESVLQAAGILAAVVAFHEAGHFAAARLQGIHVSKFAVGFGPSLLQGKGPDGIEYSLRAIPLGGFVSFPDDEPESPFDPDDPNLLRNRPLKDRVLVTSAGVIANCIFAFALCVTQAATVGISNPMYSPGVKLGSVNVGAVADKAGLQPGDVVVRVGDLKVAPSPAAVGQVVSKIGANPNKQLMLQVERPGKGTLEIPITPAEQPDGGGRIGVSLAPNVKIERKKATSFGQALVLGTQDMATLTGTVLRGLSQILSNFKESASSVSGPVAILAVGSEVARTNSPGLYQFAALLNLNLAIFNVLPLPALDGFTLALLGVEWVRGKKLDRDTEDIIGYLGTATLVILGVWLLTRDLDRLLEMLLHGGKPPPG